MKSELKCLLQLNSAVYYGFTGSNNLGDEAIWQATEKQFKEVNLYPVKRTRLAFVNQLLSIKNKKLIMLGGGTLIGDNKADGTNLFREEYEFFSKQAGYRVAFGTGVGSIYGEHMPPLWLTQWQGLLDKFDYIGVRGKESQKTLKVLGVDSEVIGDSACTWAYSKRRKITQRILGVNIGARRDLLPEEKMREYAEFVGKKNLTGWDIEFYVLNPSDYQLTVDFAGSCGISNPDLFTIYNDTEKYLTKVSETQCFIGTRLHSVILAMCAGVPSIMIGYAPKAHDFMGSISMERFNISMSDLTGDKLSEIFEVLLGDTVNVSNEILNNLNVYKSLQKLRAKEICSQL